MTMLLMVALIRHDLQIEEQLLRLFELQGAGFAKRSSRTFYSRN